MPLKRKSRLQSVCRVVIHPEIHRALFRQRADTGQTIQEQVHEILCGQLGRADLIRKPLPVES